MHNNDNMAIMEVLIVMQIDDTQIILGHIDSLNKSLHNILTHTEEIKETSVVEGIGEEEALKEDQIFKNADLSPRVVNAVKYARKVEKQGNGENALPVRVQPKSKVVSQQGVEQLKH